MNLIPAWARRRPWHNWAFAGFYITTLAQGIAALVTPPDTVLDHAGFPLTLFWGAATSAAGLIGFFGAIGPTVTLPFIAITAGRLHYAPYRMIAPNFRAEQTAAVIGWLGVFVYASTIWGLLLAQDGPTSAAGAWGVTSHFWPFLIRWLYFHYRERAEVQKREVIARIVADSGSAPLPLGEPHAAARRE